MLKSGEWTKISNYILENCCSEWVSRYFINNDIVTWIFINNHVCIISEFSHFTQQFLQVSLILMWIIERNWQNNSIWIEALNYRKFKSGSNSQSVAECSIECKEFTVSSIKQFWDKEYFVVYRRFGNAFDICRKK